MDLIANIRSALEFILDLTNGQLKIIADFITMSPEKFFGEEAWDKIIQLGTSVLMPFALTILCFFIAMEIYHVYCKSNGDLDIQLVSVTFFKFVFPFMIITHSYDILNYIFVAINKLVISMSSEFITVVNNKDLVIEGIMKAVNEMDFWGQILYLFQVWALVPAMAIMTAVIFLILFGRIFEIVLHWFFFPAAVATFISSEENQIGKNYLKTFMALVFQGGLMILCIIFYATLLSTTMLKPGSSAVFMSPFYTALLLLVIVKTGHMSKRMLGTF